MLPDDATPQVDCLIALAQAEHPGYGRTEQAEFYEAVHMELAPMARQLERDARKWRMRLHQLRLDVLSVMPESWREDPDWVKLAENQKLTTKVGAGETAKKAQMLDKAAIEKLCNEQFTLSIAQFVKNVESEVLRRNGLTPNVELRGAEAASSPKGRARP